MRILILFVLAFLVGCSTFQHKDIPAGTLVYEDEYVVDAQQPFKHKSPGVLGRAAIYPPGLYLINVSGESVEIGSESDKIVAYDESNDFCKTPEMKEVSCSPNFVVSVDSTNDPLLDQYWGLQSGAGSNAVEAWKEKKESPDIKIAVLDTGINCEHEDIECMGGYNAITDREGLGAQRDDNGHGTHVAGTICGLGNNNVGGSGVTQKCQLYGIKFLSSRGSGSLYSAIRGLEWAIENDIDIVNNSWGGGGFSTPLFNKIKEAQARGILLTAAAGNRGVNNDDKYHYPSNYQSTNIIAVASTTSNNQISTFSNYGAESVDVGAPGSAILSTWSDGGYKTISGTSMATPHITGAAALYLQQNRGASPEQVIGAIKDSARKEGWMSGKVVSGGVLDVKELLRGQGEEPTKPISCKVKACKTCVGKCNEKFNCSLKKNKQCRSKCRRNNSCKKGCRD